MHHFKPSDTGVCTRGGIWGGGSADGFSNTRTKDEDCVRMTFTVDMSAEYVTYVMAAYYSYIPLVTKTTQNKVVLFG